jgi:carbon starvation protein
MKTSFFSLLIWLGVALLGAAAVGGIALNRGESINALWFITAALCVYAIAYRFYAAWIAATVLSIDATRATPAERLNNGATSCRPTAGSSSAIISRPSPDPAR